MNSVNHLASSTSNVFLGGPPYFTIPSTSAMIVRAPGGSVVTAILPAGSYSGSQIATSLTTGLATYMGYNLSLTWNGSQFILTSSVPMTLTNSPSQLGMAAGPLPVTSKPFGPGNITIAPGTGIILGASSNIVATNAVNILAPGLLVNGSAILTSATGLQVTSDISNSSTSVAASASLTYGLNQSLTAQGTAISKVNSNLVSTQSNVATLSSNLTAAQSNVTALQAAVSTVNSNLVATQSNVATVQTSVGTVNSNLVATQSNVATVSSNLASTQSNVAALSSNLVATQANVAALQSNLAATQSNVGLLQGNVTSLVTANIAVNNQLSNLFSALNVALGIPGATLAAGGGAITGAVLSSAASSTNYLSKTGGSLTGALTLTSGAGALTGTSTSTTITGIYDITLSNSVITSNLVASGNVTGAYILGNGSKLSNLPFATSNAFGNAATATVLLGNSGYLTQVVGANIWANTAGDLTLNSNAVITTGSLYVQGNKQVTGNLVVSGNIGSLTTNTNMLGNVVLVGGSYYGDGSKLTGISTGANPTTSNAFGTTGATPQYFGNSSAVVNIDGSQISIGAGSSDGAIYLGKIGGTQFQSGTMYFQGTANFNAATVTGLPTAASATSFGTSSGAAITVGSSSGSTTVTGSSLVLGSAGLPYSINGMPSPIAIGVCLSDETTPITTTGVKITVPVPYNFTITQLPMWSCNGSPGSTVTMDIQIVGFSIYSSAPSLFSGTGYQATQNGTLGSSVSGLKYQAMTFILNSTGTNSVMYGLKCIVFLN